MSRPSCAMSPRTRVSTSCWSGRTCGRARPRSPPPASRPLPRGTDRDRLRRAADAGAGAGGGAARGAGGDGQRQPHPLRPQRPQVLPGVGRDHQGRRGRHPRGAGARRPCSAPRDRRRRRRRRADALPRALGRLLRAGAPCRQARRRLAAQRRGPRSARGGARGARGGAGGARPDRRLRADRHRSDRRRRCGADRGLGARAPAGCARLDRRRRRPTAGRRRTRHGAARRRARHPDRAGARCRCGGDAAERDDGARTLGLVRTQSSGRGSARPS